MDDPHQLLVKLLVAASRTSMVCFQERVHEEITHEECVIVNRKGPPTNLFIPLHYGRSSYNFGKRMKRRQKSESV